MNTRFISRMPLRRVIVAGAALLAITALTGSVRAQNSSNAGACDQGKQAAMAQLNHTYNSLYVGLENRLNDAQTAANNEKSARCNGLLGQQAIDCNRSIDAKLSNTITDIENEINNLAAKERDGMNIISGGICAPSPAELAQLLSSLSQVVQATGQVISASKGNGSGGGAGQQTANGAGEQTPSNAQKSPNPDGQGQPTPRLTPLHP